MKFTAHALISGFNPKTKDKRKEKENEAHD